ncbi:alpha/beta superfamily hydrolase (macronuclear) [Tetrahymena thermophila SB210]|uniref:Alpha/beta superfamily hydrolase n=1 Tax=Tetrahymena thermophila (strain SB210) TaxID=312017 RepID=I7M1E8_TETTS|nr:alpha/beta superfamily hydrolase [Tetrahymena thermophila SB210]EAR96191.1 alpha/beta superfamily hydrolase [Tetrahymena thermophila SB210]|eukprot:XP_001016436.1 alpha/beta superfamily hydrolase [Tetrahymena thermophila SB210]
MELNSIIFPAPKCSYTKESRNIIWVESHAINTPIYHQQNINKEQNLCNESEIQAKRSGPFSSCMTGLIDKENEIEVLQNQRNANRSLSCIQGESKNSNQQFHKTLTDRNILCDSQQNQQSPIIQEFTPSHQHSNKKFQYFSDNFNEQENKPQYQQFPQTARESKQKFDEGVIHLNSPIRNNKKHSSMKEMYISSPLRKAAEFGPTLKNATSTSIPCLYLPYFEGSDKLLIYFHGNAEDLGYSYDFVSNLRRYIRVNVLAVEYPGYGLYKGSPNSDQILQDADSIYEFVRTHLKVQSQNIIIFGRSIGSGPACYLAGTRNIGGLILMCPYTSIRNVVKHLAGNLIQYLVAERFRNIDYIKHSKCPILFIHGKMDKLIPYTHSLELMEQVKDRALIHLSPQMTHNEFSMSNDLILPIKTFFCQAKLTIQKQKLVIPPQFFNAPNEQPQQSQQKQSNISAASITKIRQ